MWSVTLLVIHVSVGLSMSLFRILMRSFTFAFGTFYFSLQSPLCASLVIGIDVTFGYIKKIRLVVANIVLVSSNNTMKT